MRLHQKPNAEEVRACAAWWRARARRASIPSVVVLLGATAAQAALGPKVRVTRDRGVVIPAGDRLAYDALVTVHPSAVLRMRDPERDAAFAELGARPGGGGAPRRDRVSRTGGEVRVGCSGWVYRDWRGIVYPKELPQREWFARYADALRHRRAQHHLLPTAAGDDGRAVGGAGAARVRVRR